MASKSGPRRFDPRLVVAVIALLVAVLGLVPGWVPLLEAEGWDVAWLRGLLRWLHQSWRVLFALALVFLLGYLALWLRSKMVGAVKWLQGLGKRLRWWILWTTLEQDIRLRIEGLSQAGAEVLAATLRLGERRQDRRLFLCLSDAEALVRGRRHPPQGGIGGTAWAKKGCYELQHAGLVEQFADARNYEYMVWLEPRVLKSRVGDRVVDVVEGLLSSRGLWRW